jgi:hypothetical protein
LSTTPEEITAGIEALKKRQALEAIKRTAAFRDAKARTDFQAVLLVGPEEPDPQRAGSNHGPQWDLKVVVSTNPDTYLRNHQSHHNRRRVIWGEVWVETLRHAARLEKALHEMLYGRDSAERGHGAWVSIYCDNPRVLWDELLVVAVQDINRRELLETFTMDEKDQRIALLAHAGRPPVLRRVK